MNFSELTEKRWFQHTALVITILGSLMILFLSFIYLHTSNPLEVVQPFKTITVFTKPGGGLLYNIEYCSTKNFTTVFNRQLENINTGELWDVPDQVMNIVKGCVKEMRSLPIPLGVEVGTYKLRNSVIIEVNPVRSETFNYESESFTVGDYDG